MDSLAQDLLAYKAAAVALWFAAFFGAEHLAPADRRGRGWPGGWRRLGRNAALWALNSALFVAAVGPLTAWAAGQGVLDRPAWWTGWPGLALDLLLLDFLIYWWHRANHEFPLLWRFHAVHHLDRFLDTTTAVRFHWGEVLLSAGFRAVVVILLSVPLASILAFETLVLMAALFHHSNLRLPAPVEHVLRSVVITPGIHWVHHHRVRADTDSNYGTVLSVWDRLFASRSATPRSNGMAIGVEGAEERSLARLLLAPFARRARAG
jgi:sterol desaturase/sphingolipid hydroxylase (fatty acid hydroxylase superfamily)